ncbi:MAG: MFS transporter, partial [Candidatus Solibacter sp.]|nr:MFS transporter [Candidatus Solibacter sp.]
RGSDWRTRLAGIPMNISRYGWVLVGVLWVVAVLNYVDRQVIFSLFPLLARDLSLSAVQLGLLSTVFLWVYGILSPFAGFAADRFGRGRLITASLLVWSAVTLATGFSRTYGQARPATCQPPWRASPSITARARGRWRWAYTRAGCTWD